MKRSRVVADGSLPSVLAPLRAEISIWSLRPGSVASLRPAARGMQLWNLIRSSNGQEMSACYVEELELARALDFSTRTPIRRRLVCLRSVPGLLLEVPLGRAPQSKTIRPWLRWATDPARRSYWENVIARYRLPQCAEKFGLDSEWMRCALGMLDHHAEAAAILGDQIIAEALDQPCRASIQDAGGSGGDRTRLKRRRLRKKKSRRGRR